MRREVKQADVCTGREIREEGKQRMMKNMKEKRKTDVK